MGVENKIKIDALKLDDKTLQFLDFARWYGFLENLPTLVDDLASKAQIIRSVERTDSSADFPDGLFVEMYQAEYALIPELLKNEQLADLVTFGYKVETKEPDFGPTN